jgi:hypothetical protein
MDRWRSTSTARWALVICLLLAVTALGALAGLAWLAAPAALATLGASAAVAGVDSRAPGDWRR